MNIIKIELIKHKNRAIAVFTVTLLAYVFISAWNLKQYIYDYQIQIWEKAGEFFDLTFPLIIMVLAGEMVYEEKKHNYIMYIGTRIRIRSYLKYKKIGTMLAAGYVVFGISFLSFVITQYLFPDAAGVTYNTRNFEHVWLDFYLVAPVVYAVLLSIWRGVLAAVIVNFGFELSKYLMNRVLIIVTPFIVTLFLHFVLAIINLPAFSIIYSFDPSTLVPDAVSLRSMAVGPVCFLVFALLVKMIGEFYEKHCFYSKKDVL